MSEATIRRKTLIDYRITAAKCENCGATYFPPKSFCNVEGRSSKMSYLDYFESTGVLYTGTVVRKPTNRFSHFSSFLVGIVSFDDGALKVPGRITDQLPGEVEVDISDLIGREVVPRFRRLYANGGSGIVSYSSLNFSFADDYYRQFPPVCEVKEAHEKSRPGIVGYGVYLPKFRVRNEDPASSGGVEERTVPFQDEDTATFAVEAGRRALIHAGIKSRDVKKCFLGSESTPYAVKPSMSTVCQSLELGEKYEDGFMSGGVDTQFACKAATDLFIDAAALVAYPVFAGSNVMVIGSDNSQAAPHDALDSTVGAGAAAFIFGEHGVIATLDHYAPYTSDTADFYRRDGEKYPRHGGRFTGKPAYFKHVTTAMSNVLKQSGLGPRDFAYVVNHSPNARYPLAAALEMGFQREQVEPGLVVEKIGNLYSGSCLTALAAVLDIAKPGDRILATSYGSGAGSESYVFTVTDLILEKRLRSITVREQIENPKREYVDYGTYRAWKEMS
ncbi:MAG: hydroxymethylglutaryl-CoA synthase [Candidatus Bathyarchaeia archaeon]